MTRHPAPDLVARFARDLAGVAGNGWTPPSASETPPSPRLALAVSGGGDSLALLVLAHAAAPGRVIAATVDHGLRAGAADEARMVAELCAARGVPHAILRVAVADDPAGVQAAARGARYAALAAWAGAERAALLATAHHRDDQAETVLMRLARGAGLDGLAGIRPARALAAGVRLVRPLLGWSKAELGDIAAAAGLAPADDPSNRDPRFDRTRARALLAAGWPAPARVAAAAAHLAEAQAALAWSANRLAETRLRRVADDALELDVADLPRELRRRLVLAALARLSPGPWRGDEVARLLDRLAANQVSTLGGIRIAPAGTRWRLAPAPPRRQA